MTVFTTDAEKKSWKRPRGDHAVVVSNVGPGFLNGLNRRGAGLVLSSSLECHLPSAAEVPKEELLFFRLVAGGGGVDGPGRARPGAVGGGGIDGPG